MKIEFRWLLPCSLMILAAGCETPNQSAAYRPQNPDSTTVISSAPSPYASGTYNPSGTSGTYNSSSTTTYPVYASTQPSTQSTPDNSLLRQVRQQLNSYGRLGTIAQTVQMDAQNGVVTLSGVVPTQQDRDMINEVVRNTPGVVSVTDQLHVSNWSTGSSDSNSRVYSGSQAVGSEGAGQIFSLHVQGLTPADRSLAQRVINGLQTDAVLPNVLPKVNIEVADGRIILRGTVQNEEQRRAIEDAVRRAVGVGAVDDQLQIVAQ
jgi:osmotically-inducible protein OsmY